MTDIELLSLVIMQIKGFRVPTSERELIKQLWVIQGNLEALKDAMEQAREEEKTDVQSGRDDDHPVEG